jgi:large subunit ribosomal protein L24
MKNGALALERAEGAIAISAGQARLTNAVAGAQNTELALSASVGLTDGELDARLTLFGSPSIGGPESTRPEIVVLIKGPIDAPTRSIDLAAFASWLALRAVEQQSKKLDVLEGRESSAVPLPPDSPPPHSPPLAGENKAGGAKPATQAAPADHPVRAAPAPEARQKARSRPNPNKPKSLSGELAQPLPPAESRPAYMVPQPLFGAQ